MEAWIVELRRGSSESAWDLFLDRYRRLIFAAIRHYAQDYDDVMDVFARVCESLREHDLRRLRTYVAQTDHRASFSTWLVTVVRHLTIDWFRHRDGRRRISAVAERLPPLQRCRSCISSASSPSRTSSCPDGRAVRHRESRGSLFCLSNRLSVVRLMDVKETSSGRSSPTANAERIVMQWLDRARLIARGIHGISLPDPDRIDIGAVPDTVALLEAIDAAMPRTAVLELIGLRHGPLAAFLAASPDAIQHRADGYLLSLDHGTVGALARVARDCATDGACTHLFVHDGEHTLLEAFGRDRGEDVVWLSRRLRKVTLRRFLEALSPGTAPAPRASRPIPVLRQPWRTHVLASRVSNPRQVIRHMIG